ncbi:MAG: ABC transporter ATP-binding protein [bacterium]
MKSNTKKTLSYYWQATKVHKIVGLIILFSSIFGAVLDTISPIYFKKLFDVLAGPASVSRDSAVPILIQILVVISILLVMRWLFWRINSFAVNYFESRILSELANKCFAYLHKHSFSYFNNNFVGTLVKRVNWFVRAFENIADQIIFNIIPFAVTMVMVFAVLWRVNIWLSVGLLVWSLFFIFICWLFIKFKLKYDIQRNEAESTSSGILADTITNNSNVKLFNGYQRELDKYGESTDKLARIRRFAWDLGAISEAVQAIISIAMEIIVFYAAIKLWQAGKITVGDFVLIQAYIFNIMDKVWSFNRVLRVIYENLSDAEEMTVIFNTPHEINDIKNAKELKIKKGEIKFENVSFLYHKKRKIFNNFNLTVKAHERLAVIGPSGSGKTTIVKLLFRMHDINGGKILVDGQDISKVTQESLWHNISLVPQDPILFHRTLKENIRYGRPEATDEEVIEAAKSSHCHEFIIQSSEGYDTYVGERGIKLSGGERQRVAIARAILRNAPILVLDEATSSLDSESEKLIQDALNHLMKNKTVIVIAHRLSTIRQMDRIIVVDKGEVVEQGDHDMLTSKKEGIYQKLWRLQAGGFIK